MRNGTPTPKPPNYYSESFEGFQLSSRHGHAASMRGKKGVGLADMHAPWLPSRHVFRDDGPLFERNWLSAFGDLRPNGVADYSAYAFMRR